MIKIRMAYWGGAGMNFIGGARKEDRKEFLATYSDWLAANGRGPKVEKGVYVPKAYMPKPQKFYKTGLKKGQPIVRKTLTPAQKEARLVNLANAREAKSSGVLKPYTYSKFVMAPRTLTPAQKSSRKAKAAAKKALSGILGNIKY